MLINILAMAYLSIVPVITNAFDGASVPTTANPSQPVVQPADIASSAYSYRADRRAEENPPESWILLMQYAGLPYDKPVDVKDPAIRTVLCGLLWEEVRPVRWIELSWPPEIKDRPAPENVVLSFFDGTDNTAHTWWNPRTLKDAGPPTVSDNGSIYRYPIPADTWGVVATVRGGKGSATTPVPKIRAFVPETWKRMDLEIEWGFENATAALGYDGHIEVYDGLLDNLALLAGDAGTVIVGPNTWRSTGSGSARRGVQLSAQYLGNPDGDGCGLIMPSWMTWRELL